MGCDKGAVEEMNRKVNTRTSLFLLRLLAEQLSPESQLPPESVPSCIFSERETKGGGVGGKGRGRQRGEKKEDSHTCACVCVCVCVCVRALTQKHTQKKKKSACKHTHTRALQQQ